MNRLPCALPLLLAAAAAAQAAADGDAIRAAIARLAPGGAVESIRPTSLPSLAELEVGGQVV